MVSKLIILIIQYCSLCVNVKYFILIIINALLEVIVFVTATGGQSFQKKS